MFFSVRTRAICRCSNGRDWQIILPRFPIAGLFMEPGRNAVSRQGTRQGAGQGRDFARIKKEIV